MIQAYPAAAPSHRSRRRLGVAATSLLVLGTAFACGGENEAPPAPSVSFDTQGVQPGDDTNAPNESGDDVAAGNASPSTEEDSASANGLNTDSGSSIEASDPSGDESPATESEAGPTATDRIDNSGPATGSEGAPQDNPSTDDTQQPTDGEEPGVDGEPAGPQLPPLGSVEDSGLDCELPALPAFDQLQANPALPDPFVGISGERVTTQEQWRCRRQEIRQLSERFIYGEKPGRPESVTGTVTNNQVTVNVQHEGRSVSFSAGVTLPAGANGPVPAIIGLGGSSFSDTILNEGVAYINLDPFDVANENFRNPKQGPFYDLYPQLQATGNLAAWGWGVSRIIDVLEQSGTELFDVTGLGVTGCSRFGKGAFIAGAFDERVALTMPLESGMAGTAAFRLVADEPGAEVLRNAFEYRPWAGDAYRDFLVLTTFDQNDTAGRASDQAESGLLMQRLPVDTHSVMGMVAPRGLLVLANVNQANLSPRSEVAAVQAGVELYAGLGVRDNISYVSDNDNHCSFRQAFVPAMQANLRRFLQHQQGQQTGRFEPHPSLNDVQAPIDWTTPTIE